MSARRADILGRAAALAAAFAAPGFAVLAILILSHALSPAAGLGAAGGIFLLSLPFAVRFAVGESALREAIAMLASSATAESAARVGRRLPPLARELWLVVLRLARIWGERARSAELRLSEAEAVIAAVPDPLILIDERRRIVRSNDAAAAAFVAQSPEPRDLAVALRNPAVLGAADAVLGGESERVVEFAVAQPAERQLRARIARIARPSLDEAVAVITLHDITELKRAEQMRADFIANASHELRTPLASLTGFIETLRGPAREDSEARERFLAIMHGQALRMARLVDDLLSLSRIELNEHVPPTGRVVLDPVLRHAADALELRAGERGTRIALAVPSDLPPVRGDPDEIAQVFQNLFDNAIKYGRPGTAIEVAAEVVETGSRDGERARAPFVAVAVRDHGEGIARGHLPRLTERFYRVDTARSRDMGGTGLGLAIVKHILNRHRGFLEIHSEPGVGSVFTVFLPLAAGADCQSPDLS